MKISIKAIPNMGYPFDYWNANMTYISLTPLEIPPLQTYRTLAMSFTSCVGTRYTDSKYGHVDEKTIGDSQLNNIGAYYPYPPLAITTTSHPYHEFAYWKMDIEHIVCKNPYLIAEINDTQTNSSCFQKKIGQYKCESDL